jgi:hypothetical protein
MLKARFTLEIGMSARGGVRRPFLEITGIPVSSTFSSQEKGRDVHNTSL